MLVEMLGPFVPTQADLGEIQPIVCINRSDTPAGLLQPLRNLFSDKALAAGIDAADADKNCSICRRFRALCDNPVYEFCNLVQGVSGLARGGSLDRRAANAPCAPRFQNVTLFR